MSDSKVGAFGSFVSEIEPKKLLRLWGGILIGFSAVICLTAVIVLVLSIPGIVYYYLGILTYGSKLPLPWAFGWCLWGVGVLSLLIAASFASHPEVRR
mgnify:CR=1 FL=1